jgi:hypothetical protein
MLVPHIDHAASLLGQSRGPIHVRIPEERKACSHTLLHEGSGKDVVHAGPSFILHRCNSCIELSSELFVISAELPAELYMSLNPHGVSFPQPRRCSAISSYC